MFPPYTESIIPPLTVIFDTGTLPNLFEPPYTLVIVPSVIFIVVFEDILASSPPPYMLVIFPFKTFMSLAVVSAFLPPP